MGKTAQGLSREKWQVIWCLFKRKLPRKYQEIVRIFKDWCGKEPRQQSNISLCVIPVGRGRTSTTTFYLWQSERTESETLQESALSTEQTEGLGIRAGMERSAPASSKNGWAIPAPHPQRGCDSTCSQTVLHTVMPSPQINHVFSPHWFESSNTKSIQSLGSFCTAKISRSIRQAFYFIIVWWGRQETLTENTHCRHGAAALDAQPSFPRIFKNDHLMWDNSLYNVG